jgi:hypothetical protein
MASDKVLPITAQQPSEGDQLNLFTMYPHEIMDLISATHIVPPDEHFNAEPLFVVVKNILRRSTQIVDNVLLVYICFYHHIYSSENSLSFFFFSLFSYTPILSSSPN